MVCLIALHTTISGIHFLVRMHLGYVQGLRQSLTQGSFQWLSIRSVSAIQIFVGHALLAIQICYKQVRMPYSCSMVWELIRILTKENLVLSQAPLLSCYDLLFSCFVLLLGAICYFSCLAILTCVVLTGTVELLVSVPFLLAVNVLNGAQYVLCTFFASMLSCC